MKILTDTGSCQATLPELIKMLTKLQKEYGTDVKISFKPMESYLNSYWINYSLTKVLEKDNSDKSEPISLRLWIN